MSFCCFFLYQKNVSEQLLMFFFTYNKCPSIIYLLTICVCHPSTAFRSV